MKKQELLTASMLAVSATATTATTFTVTAKPPHQEAGSMEERSDSARGEKLTPRFDGLRFIETLVTAHR